MSNFAVPSGDKSIFIRPLGANGSPSLNHVISGIGVPLTLHSNSSGLPSWPRISRNGTVNCGPWVPGAKVGRGSPLTWHFKMTSEPLSTQQSLNPLRKMGPSPSFLFSGRLVSTERRQAQLVEP
uniref:Uncharacterized protein n=1 Tax=Romanomermis culicivorax TaxID=13658 RepID=A0A915I7F0_ROMCU